MCQAKVITQWFLMVLFIYPSFALSEKVTIHAGVPITWDRLEHYQEVTKSKGCDQINDYALAGASRGLSEMLLICQSLHIGGLDYVFEFVKVNNYARLLSQVSNGYVLLMMESAWLSDVDHSKVFVSDALLETGAFEVGIFTLPTHKNLLSVRNIQELQKFKAISNRNWTVDWQTLQFMGIETENTSRYPLMFKMVSGGRGDFMLDAFSKEPDMSQTTEGIKLIPVPNIKIGLKGSRHILVNKKMPNAQRVFDALQEGLTVLRKNGTIAKAYDESGFINQRVKDWKKLCCEE